jgi:23S rRNA pseudouridine1911/1915/1917 synthase
VHLSSIGHSIVGDGVYGRTAEGPITRQALHATRLSFEHPITGKALSFMCPLPEDFEMALAWYGLSYNNELEQRPFDSAAI